MVTTTYTLLLRHKHLGGPLESINGQIAWPEWIEHEFLCSLLETKRVGKSVGDETCFGGEDMVDCDISHTNQTLNKCKLYHTYFRILMFANMDKILSMT